MPVIVFERYRHVGDLFLHYAIRENRLDIVSILKTGIADDAQAEKLSKFAWDMAGFINEDSIKGRKVLGSTDNIEMIPDINYELTIIMKKAGFYSVWQSVANREMN